MAGVGWLRAKHRPGGAGRRTGPGWPAGSGCTGPLASAALVPGGSRGGEGKAALAGPACRTAGAAGDKRERWAWFLCAQFAYSAPPGAGLGERAPSGIQSQRRVQRGFQHPERI